MSNPSPPPQPPPKSIIKWIKTVELGYVTSSSITTNSQQQEEEDCVCFHCGASPSSKKDKEEEEEEEGSRKKKLSKCSKCQVASYCSRDCQVKDWKGGLGGGHKYSCSAYKRVGPKMSLTTPTHQTDARNEIYTRIRFYICPYAIHKYQTLNKGFIFLQSDSTLAELSLAIPKDCNGKMLKRQRFVLVHYLTLGEYDSELCKDDFELACIRSELKRAVEGGSSGDDDDEENKGYDETKEMVVLMRFRCGHLAVGVAPLVPDYNVCKSLGREYYGGNNGGSGALQLNLDDL